MNTSLLSTSLPKDFNNLRSLEWLETNGLGGYASSTVSGAHSRRYHGLLVAAMHPPVERVVVLSKLDEVIVAGEQRFDLGSNQYPGAIHPKGFENIKSFTRDLFPEFVFEVNGIEVKKTVAAVNGENTTLVIYEVLSAVAPFTLELYPFAAARDYHSIAHANDSLRTDYTFESGIFRTRNYESSPELFIAVPGSEFQTTQHWYNRVEFSIEAYRGLDFQEDLFNHGKFSVSLKKGDKLGVIISTDNPKGKDALALFRKEKQRREVLVKQIMDPRLRQLVLAADQFIVRRGDDLKTIIAGYHWFSDWGRDTMISLPGLCLVTGRFDDAKKILQAFAQSVSEGMLPNRFPDYGEAPEYNTVDATLWFFHAIYKYYQYTSDIEFIRALLPGLKDIVEWHYKGTRYNIHVDVDELLYAGQDGVQLTWMDAKVGDWVVTPRKGKAVEINALWHNALCVMAVLSEATGDNAGANDFRQKAKKVKNSFNLVFWNDHEECLYDVVDTEYKNDDLRPNQIYAISLPFNLLSMEKARKVLDRVTEKLLTARGLRSLSADHPEYKAAYGGDQWHRDGAYHQGTVWSFLLGPYIDALHFIHETEAKATSKAILNRFFEHFNESVVGSISEIFDADEPHTARGCAAQAWGVAEITRVALEYKLFASTNRNHKDLLTATNPTNVHSLVV